jgi:hypothetical protein
MIGGHTPRAVIKDRPAATLHGNIVRLRFEIDRSDPGGTPSPDTRPPGSKEPTS